MLRVTESNRLEALAERLVDELAVPAGGVLVPDVVVVQNAGMARWLQLRIATALGLCANVRFPFPAAFVWEVFERVLGPAPAGAAFEPAITTWRLMEVLATLESAPRFAPLDAYLRGGDGDDRRRHALACRIADVFDQYLVYRPDWIRRWEAGEDDHWQAELWRRIVRGSAHAHRVHRLDAFLAALAGGRIAAAALPPRIAIFGIPTLPPAFLEVFARLGELTAVHLYLMNPCRAEWSTIVSERDLARRTTRLDAAAAHFEVGHPLLASLGQQGREFIDRVRAQVEGQIDDVFVAPDEATVLGRLQGDVLALRTRAMDTPAVTADDRSIAFHACHGPLREVEVLHDQLLALFDAEPRLRPSDVVVMTPDIETYAPAFEAVFGTAPSERYIPFAIADRGLGTESALVRAFLAILELPQSRYEASRLLALLDVDSVQRRFGFTEVDLALARDWVRAAGIRWGVDAPARAALGLPPTHEHTWRFGLDRLFLGYAHRGDERRLLAGILPFDDVEGTQARALGLLATFAEAAFALRESLAAPRPPTAWVTTLLELLDRFLMPREEDEEDAQAIRRALAALADAVGTAGAEGPVSLGVVEAHLRGALGRVGPTGRFLAGRVTVCAMIPMRSIPFEVVCLVGMNDGSFPRAHRSVGFDLMTEDVRPGDRSRRDDDRWLFLEAILSARRHLYVSWIGRDIRDNARRPPSPLVGELLDVLAREHGLTEPVVEHPLQPFSPRYFGDDERLFSYVTELAAASRVAARERHPPTRFLAARLPEAGPEWRTVTVDALVRFYRNPARFLLRERLGIRLEESEGLVESREPLVLDGLEAYTLRDELVARLRDARTLDDALAVARAAGLVPHGRIGEAVVRPQAASARAMARRLDELVRAPSLPGMPVDLDCGGIRVIGVLDGVTRDGRVEHRPGAAKAADWTSLWIRHLVLHCVAAPEVARRSWYVGRDAEIALRPVADAHAALAALVARYWDGLHRPLKYVPGAALAALNARARDDALATARRAWRAPVHGRRTPDGEDPYLALAFRGVDPIDDEFLGLAREILGPALGAAEVHE